MCMRLVPIFVALIPFVVHSAAADPGHLSGTKKGRYDGHAAALGEPIPAQSRSARTIEIALTDDMRFRPGQITVMRGQTIKFVLKNLGQIKHEFVLGTEQELLKHAAEMEKFPEMEHDDPNQVTVEPGQTATLFWKFTKVGTWNVGYGCLIPGHFSAGMKGKIVVHGS